MFNWEGSKQNDFKWALAVGLLVKLENCVTIRCYAVKYL